MVLGNDNVKVRFQMMTQICMAASLMMDVKPSAQKSLQKFS